MYKNYNVVVANDIDDLSIKVGHLLDVGYTTAGGVQIVTNVSGGIPETIFYQSVVLNKTYNHYSIKEGI